MIATAATPKTRTFLMSFMLGPRLELSESVTSALRISPVTRKIRVASPAGTAVQSEALL